MHLFQLSVLAEVQTAKARTVMSRAIDTFSGHVKYVKTSPKLKTKTSHFLLVVEMQSDFAEAFKRHLTNQLGEITDVFAIAFDRF